ncbi:MAG: 50S ribosomal protein L13 [Myxococcota bacterium]|nr:50S ribosomal protein L13 [Myxococcota bacterium]
MRGFTSHQTVEQAYGGRAWFIVDGEGKVLGRAASKIAHVLRGKHKPTYSPHLDGGDFVVVVNADKFVLTGAKEEDKVYWHHTGFVGGIKGLIARRQRVHKAEDMIYRAVKGMLPKGRLGRQMIRKLKIYNGPSHPHAAQTPKALEV